MSDPTCDQITKEATGILERAGALVIELSENQEVYDLHYISRHLAKCSAYCERLAEYLARMAQLKIQTLLGQDRAANALELARAEAEERLRREAQEAIKREKPEEAPDLREAPLGRALTRATRAQRREVQRWATAGTIVDTVKREVGRRADTVKRLDSDLRLHEKIIEAKITAGAIGRPDLVGEPKPRIRGEEHDLSPPRGDPVEPDIDLD